MRPGTASIRRPRRSMSRPVPKARTRSEPPTRKRRMQRDSS
jgi:hypothetical protein